MSSKTIPYFKGEVVGKRFLNNSSSAILIDLSLYELHGHPLGNGYIGAYAIGTKDQTQYRIGQRVSVDITIEDATNELPTDN